MYIRKLNSKCVFEYPIDSGKKLVAGRMFWKKQNRTFFVCLVTADSIYIIVSSTKGSHFIVKKK